jgi:hypothetical protein
MDQAVEWPVPCHIRNEVRDAIEVGEVEWSHPVTFAGQCSRGVLKGVPSPGNQRHNRAKVGHPRRHGPSEAGGAPSDENVAAG